MKKLLLFGSMLALPFAAYGQTYFFDDFNDKDVSDWTRYDVDGDGNQWGDTFVINNAAGVPSTPVSLISRSWQTNPLTPNNWIVSPAINLTSATGAVNLSWRVQCAAAAWDNEKYSVYVSTSSDMASLIASPVTFSETYNDPDNLGTQYLRTLDVSSLVGQTIYVAFRHHGVTDQDFISIDDVRVAKPAIEAPLCATLTSPANNAAGINYQAPLVLKWTQATSGGSADSYDVYLDSNPNPTTKIGSTGSTTFTVNNLLGSATYYWKVVPKNAIGEAIDCSVFSFTTNSNPYAPYCGPLTIVSTKEPITRVKFAGIDNVSPAPTVGAIGHENFTSIVGNVSPSSSYEIVLEGNTNGNYDNRFVVFIDWNQNGTLDDAGEVYEITSLLKNSTGVDGKQIKQSLAVPSNALTGNTRMRVKKIFSVADFLNPCKGASFGQIEDYTINVGTLAVSNANKSSVKLYPNPVVDLLNIEAETKVSTVQVFDLTGKVVSSFEMNAVKNQVNMSTLTPGFYVVTIQTETGVQSVKIVKK